MSINRHARAVALLSINKAIPHEVIDTHFGKFEQANIGVEGLRWSWWRFVRPGGKTPETVSADSFFASPSRRRLKRDDTTTTPIYMLTCHEVLIKVLQDSCVFDDAMTPCSYLPDALYHRSIKTINGFAYSEPKEVSLDEHVSNPILTIERN